MFEIVSLMKLIADGATGVFFSGNLGCEWIRIRNTLVTLIGVPILIYAFIYLHIHRGTYLSVNGTVESINPSNVAKIKYQVHSQTYETTVDILGERISIGSILVYYNKKHPNKCFLSQPLGMGARITLMVLCVLLGMFLLITLILLYTDRNLCNYWGGVNNTASKTY